MADEKRYSVEEAAKKLGTGVSTLYLWQHIYSEFLTAPGEDGQRSLSREDLHLFTYISECTESGLTREEIRQALRNRASGKGPLFSGNAFRSDTDEEILSLLDEEHPTPALLARLVIQQRRLADAEERKASAMERRLAIEAEKSRSLAALLTALETTGLSRAPLPAAEPAARPQEPPQDVPSQARGEHPGASAPPEPEAPEAPDVPQEESSDDAPPMDNLWGLVENEAPGHKPEQAPPSAQANRPPTEKDLDDLWALVDENPDRAGQEGLDNLWDLVDEKPGREGQEELDNLWDLVDEKPGRDGREELDNLWDLVGEKPGRDGREELDNLWNLVDEKPGREGQETLDNLWDLVDEAPPGSVKKPMGDTGLDDLWATKDPTPEPAAPVGTPDTRRERAQAPPHQPDRTKAHPAPAQPDIPREKEAAPPYPADPADYKDFILKEIIGLKRREGLSAAQVADRLNEEAKPTLSGKGAWGARTIEGIFRIIEKAGP